MAEDCVALGLAERRPGGRYRLLTRARSFGGTLEWWVARELSTRLGLDVASGVRSGARGIGGDLDLIAAVEGKVVYVELKSGPPKHLTDAEIDAFLRRLRALRPDLALFVMDTALRLSDKVLPMLEKALLRPGSSPFTPRRIVRDTWALTPHLYLVSAKENLIENARRAIAEGLRALAPPTP
jgi:Holliday junction resolvase-like predicted endonuclease